MEQITEDVIGGNHLRLAGWAAIPLILLVPLIAMQFTDEVNWSISDFIVFGAMLAVVGIGVELFLRVSANSAYRVGAVIAIVGAFLLVWANLAVGVIGNEENPANLAYFGILGIGFVGSILARLKAAGMAVVMAVLVALLILFAAFALFMGLGSSNPTWPRGIVLTTGFMGAMWAGSALLFRRAARDTERGAE